MKVFYKLFWSKVFFFGGHPNWQEMKRRENRRLLCRMLLAALLLGLLNVRSSYGQVLATFLVTDGKNFLTQVQDPLSWLVMDNNNVGWPKLTPSGWIDKRSWTSGFSGEHKKKKSLWLVFLNILPRRNGQEGGRNGASSKKKEGMEHTGTELQSCL